MKGERERELPRLRRRRRRRLPLLLLTCQQSESGRPNLVSLSPRSRRRKEGKNLVAFALSGDVKGGKN